MKTERLERKPHPLPTRRDSLVFQRKLMDYMQLERQYRQAKAGTDGRSKKQTRQEAEVLAQQKAEVSTELTALEQEMYGTRLSRGLDGTDVKPRLLRKSLVEAARNVLMLVGLPITAGLFVLEFAISPIVAKIRGGFNQASSDAYIFWKTDISDAEFAKHVLAGAVWEEGGRKNDEQKRQQALDALRSQAARSEKSKEKTAAGVVSAVVVLAQLPVIFSIPVAESIGVWTSRVLGAWLLIVESAIAYSTWKAVKSVQTQATQNGAPGAQ